MNRIAMALSAMSDFSLKYFRALSRRGPYTLLPSASPNPGNSQTPAFVKFPAGRRACRLSLKLLAGITTAVVFVIVLGTSRAAHRKIPVEVVAEPDPPHWMSYSLYGNGPVEMKWDVSLTSSVPQTARILFAWRRITRNSLRVHPRVSQWHR